MQLLTDEVNLLCGASYRPQEGGLYRRAGTEPVRIRTTEGAEFIDKRRVRKMGQDGREQEVLLNSYAEIRRRKGMFEEVLESICHGASGSGVGKMLGVSASQVCEGWKARSRELLAEFRGRDLSKLDVLAMMVDGVFPTVLPHFAHTALVDELRPFRGADPHRLRACPPIKAAFLRAITCPAEQIYLVCK